MPGETTQHFCRFTRPQYNWQQYAPQCTYTASTYRYTTVYGDDYCRYKHYRDVFTHPIYSYAYIPNDGDIVGFTSRNFVGNDDLHGTAHRRHVRRRPVLQRRLPEPHPDGASQLLRRRALQAELAHQYHLLGKQLPERPLQPLAVRRLAVGDRAGGVRHRGGSDRHADRPELPPEPDGLLGELARRKRPPGPLPEVPERQHLQPDRHQPAQSARVQPARPAPISTRTRTRRPSTRRASAPSPPACRPTGTTAGRGSATGAPRSPGRRSR